jgi:hypothetical protein
MPTYSSAGHAETLPFRMGRTNIRSVGQGLSLGFKSLPPLSDRPIPVVLPKDKIKHNFLLAEVDTMLEKGAIEECLFPYGPGFYSHIFVIPKRTGDLRPVINLRSLNSFLSVPTFKMETVQQIRSQLKVGDWVVKHKFSKYLRFAIKKWVFQFKAMCFGLSTPLIFYEGPWLHISDSWGF